MVFLSLVVMHLTPVNQSLCFYVLRCVWDFSQGVCFSAGELRAAVRTKRAVFLSAGSVSEPCRQQRCLVTALPRSEDARTARDARTVPDRRHGTVLQGPALTSCCPPKHLLLITKYFITNYVLLEAGVKKLDSWDIRFLNHHHYEKSISFFCVIDTLKYFFIII